MLVEILPHNQASHFFVKAENAFWIEPSHVELTHADLQAPLLQCLAKVTGGHYCHLSEADNPPDAVTVSKSSYSKSTE